MSDQFEPLEQRRLFTIPTSNGGVTLNLTDSPDVSYITSGDDFLEIILSGGNISVRNSSGTVIDSHSATGITGVSVNTGGGNDTVRIGGPAGGSILSIPVTIHGGTGNDTITGGLGNDQLFGDAGNDRLDGRAGQDSLDGGANDFDTADYSYRANQVKVSLDGVNNDGTNAGNNSSTAQYTDSGHDNVVNMEAVLGGTGPDSLTGNSSANWLDGGGGNDTIFGGDGIDTIVGGVNTDLAYGEGGNDNFFMQDSTADQFLGGAGTTTAQFDNALDTPAPAPAAIPAAALSSLSALIGPESAEDFFIELQSKTTLNTSFKVTDVALQFVGDDEKIIIVGSANGPDTNGDDAFVARYNQTGEPDATFGDGGFVFTDFGGGEGQIDDSANSVIVDDIGRIIIAGNSGSAFVPTINTYSGFADWVVVRYLPNGTLDSDFGNGGIAVVNDGNPSYDDAQSILIQTVQQGSDFNTAYLVGGTLGYNVIEGGPYSDDFGIARLDLNGNLDTSFGDGGFVRTDFDDENSTDLLTELVIDPETGNIWATGSSSPVEGNFDFAVVGYSADGSEIDGSRDHQDFNDGSNDFANDAVIDSSGQLVLAGYSAQGDSLTGAIATFDTSPIILLSVSESFVDHRLVEDSDTLFYGLTLDNEGHAVAVGQIDFDEFYIYRFNTDDLSQFGTPFIAGFEFGGDFTYDLAFAAATMSDGRIIVAGSANDGIAWLRLGPGDEEPSFVDNPLSPEDVQNFVFTYLDQFNEPQPIPQDLVDRLKALKPDGTLEIFGTPNPDVITLCSDGSIITATVNGIPLQVNAADVTGILVHGLDGNDRIEFCDAITVPTTVEGGAGDDSVCGTQQVDKFYGGIGNDRFWGFGGDDQAWGEDGNDALIMGAGNDSAWGGNGRDFLIGGRGMDLLRGDAGEDILFGGATFFDNSCDGASALFVEFASGHALTQRVQLIGTIILRLGTRFSLFNDDNEVDNLGGGADKDWFIAKTTGPNADLITDFVNGTDIKTSI